MFECESKKNRFVRALEGHRGEVWVDVLVYIFTNILQCITAIISDRREDEIPNRLETVVTTIVVL